MKEKVIENKWVLLFSLHFYFFLLNFSFESIFNSKIFIITILPTIIVFAIMNISQKSDNYMMLFIGFYILPFYFFEFVKIPFLSIKKLLDNNTLFIFIVIAIGFTIIFYLYKNQFLYKKIIQILVISFTLLSIKEIARLYIEKNEPELNFKKFSNNYNLIFIIFDEYTSPYVLKKEFNFQFETKQYTDKGYFIANNSTSKFSSTFFSLNNLFSLGNDSIELSNINLPRVLNRLKHNKLFELFKKNNYNMAVNSFISYNNRKTTEQYLENASDYSCISSSIIFTYLTLKQQKSYLNLNENDFKKSIFNDVKKRKITSEKYLEKLLNLFSENTNSGKPFFLHYHFTIPHAPYIFNTQDTSLSLENIVKIDKKGYKNNVIYSNTILYEILDSFAKSKINKNTILIIQGDHGYRGNDILKRHHKNILNIVYVPNKKYNRLNDTISNSSTFIHILNNFYYNKNNFN